MKIYAIYFSPTKGTETIVKIIAKEFGNYNEIDLCRKDLNSDFTFHKDDICIVGVPSYGGRVPSIALERMKNFNGNCSKTILIVSYGNRAYDDTLMELQNYLTARNFECIAAISAIAQHSIINQFANGRPDETDKKQLIQFVEQISKKLNAPTTHKLLTLPGNYPYKEYNGIPLKPATNRHCTKCGLCAKQCPVAAIPTETPNKTNKKVCISCMRCVTICPKNSRTVSKIKLKLATFKMKKSCLARKENELFL